MLQPRIIFILIVLLINSSFAIAQKKSDNENDLIFRFDIQLQAGTYPFYEGEYFPEPQEASYKPETFLPDAYFLKHAKSIKIGNSKMKYGAYILTSKSEYVYLKLNGKKGWLKTSVPIETAKKALLRNELSTEFIKRSTETHEKLGIEYQLIHCVPFQNPDFVLVFHEHQNFILDLKNRKVTLNLTCEGAEINFKTNNVECYGDLGGGRYVFDQYGKPVKEKVSKEELAQLDQYIQKEYDVKPGTKQAAFLKRYTMAMMSNDGKTFSALMDSVQRLGVPLSSLLPKRKVHPLTASQAISKAAEQNNIPRIDSILKIGFPIDSTIIYKEGKPDNQAITLLSAATLENNIPLMEHLINKKANVNRSYKKQMPPICFAKSTEAFNLLFSKGASLEKFNYQDFKKRNIYPTEYLYTNKDINSIIVEKAPSHLFKDFDFYDKILYSYIRNSDSTSINKLLKRGATLNKPDKPGLESPGMEDSQPLYYAENKALFKFMIKNGARLTNLNYHGFNAHSKAFGWQDKQLVEWLESRGLPIQKPNNPYFVGLKDTTFITYLLKRGISINSTDSYGNTALIRAKHFETNPALEEFLLKNGADKNILNKQGGSYYIGRRRRD